MVENCGLTSCITITYKVNHVRTEHYVMLRNGIKEVIAIVFNLIGFAFCPVFLFKNI